MLTGTYAERFLNFRGKLKKVLIDLNVFSSSFYNHDDFEKLEQHIKCLIYESFNFKAEIFAVRQWFQMEKIEFAEIQFEAFATELTFTILADIFKLKSGKND